uniref:Uncharacterized protein n=1 Tax=Lotharella oceanica TaxID=641309 RepID=A0A7S2TKF1_9EUKA|mmetsp:Transcript_16554/g.31382  ORF Transcript_16554/g.31382 Transcript_16554/m.31382 type:complete len:226 (+) Transcript_16554:1-678(+)
MASSTPAAPPKQVSERKLNHVMRLVGNIPALPKWMGLYKLQAPVMDFLRPALWGQKLRCKRSLWSSCTWRVTKDGEEFPLDRVLARLRAVEEIKTQVTQQKQAALSIAEFTVASCTQSGSADAFFKSYFYTPRKQWLDVQELQLSRDKDAVKIEALSFSAGLLPASTPLAPLFNVLFFWFAFSDWSQNRLHLATIKKWLEDDGLKVEESDVKETVAFRPSAKKGE